MKYLVFILLIAGSLSFAGGWAINEKTYLEGFSELEEKQIISFKDSVNSQPIHGAAVEVFGELMYSDKNGYLSLPKDKLKGVLHEYIPLKVKKAGYRELNDLLEIELESVTNKFFIMEKGSTRYGELLVVKKGSGTVYLNGKKLSHGKSIKIQKLAHGTYRLKRVSGKTVVEKNIKFDQSKKKVEL